MPTYKERIYTKSHSALKDVYQRVTGRGRADKGLLFIMGCQRSGTRLMATMFQTDLNTKVFYEQSALSEPTSDSRLRLYPLPEVAEIIDRQPAPFVVAKPLAESQRALDLLDYFPDARALWMFRHYKEVVNSNLKKFGLRNGINDIRPMVEGNLANWRAERITAETRAIIQRYFDEEMNPYDAAALFWYARNALFFDQNLMDHPRVIACRYQNLVENPLGIMQTIYGFVGADFPGAQIIADVHTNSLGADKPIDLSPDVDALCTEMYARLSDVFEHQKFAFAGASG